MNLIKLLYVLTIGILVAAFIGFGLDTFYPAPKYPKYPMSSTSTDYKSSGRTQEQRSYDKEANNYQNTMKTYNQTASIILITLSILILATSIVVLNKLEIIGDGITLGGVFTLLYGIGRTFSVSDPKFRFGMVAVALAIILSLTYLKFIKPGFSFSFQKSKGN